MAIRDIDTDAAAAHEMFQSFDCMEGLPVRRPPRPRGSAPQAFLQRVYPGVLVA